MDFFDNEIIDVEGLSDEALDDVVGGGGLADHC